MLRLYTAVCLHVSLLAACFRQRVPFQHPLSKSYPSRFTQIRHLADTRRNSVALNSRCRGILGAGSETSLGESGPELT